MTISSTVRGNNGDPGGNVANLARRRIRDEANEGILHRICRIVARPGDHRHSADNLGVFGRNEDVEVDPRSLVHDSLIP